MATYGFNFRASSGYVTDAADDTYVLDSDAYPVTRGGRTFGWVTAPAGAVDRTTGSDPRLAGIVYNSTGGAPDDLQIDLSGDMTFRVALGDTATGRSAYLDVRDGSGSKVNFAPATSGGAANYVDATGTNRTSAADWVTNNAASAQYTFATNVVLRLDGDTGNPSCIAHFSLTQAGGGGLSIPIAMHHFKQMMGAN